MTSMTDVTIEGRDRPARHSDHQTRTGPQVTASVAQERDRIVDVLKHLRAGSVSCPAEKALIGNLIYSRFAWTNSACEPCPWRSLRRSRSAPNRGARYRASAGWHRPGDHPGRCRNPLAGAGPPPLDQAQRQPATVNLRGAVLGDRSVVLPMSVPVVVVDWLNHRQTRIVFRADVCYLHAAIYLPATRGHSRQRRFWLAQRSQEPVRLLERLRRPDLKKACSRPSATQLFPLASSW